jgi:hypothetical protein
MVPDCPTTIIIPINDDKFQSKELPIQARLPFSELLAVLEYNDESKIAKLFPAAIAVMIICRGIVVFIKEGHL